MCVCNVVYVCVGLVRSGLDLKDSCVCRIGEEGFCVYM